MARRLLTPAERRAAAWRAARTTVLVALAIAAGIVLALAARPAP